MNRSSDPMIPPTFDALSAAKTLVELEKQYAHPLNETAILTLLEGQRFLLFDASTEAYLAGDAPAQPNACPRAQLNFERYVDSLQTAQATFNTHLFEEHIAQARRLLDDVVDLVRKRSPRDADPHRRVSLGIANVYEGLAAMNLAADSEESLSWLGRVMALLAQTSYRVGAQLAQERGKTSTPEEEEALCAQLEARFPNTVARQLIADVCSHGLRNGAAIGVSPVFSAGSVLTASHIALANCLTKWNDVPTPATLQLTVNDAVERNTALQQQVRQMMSHGCALQFVTAAQEKMTDDDDMAVVAARTVTTVRPKELVCDVVRFQNNKEKWVAFVGLLNGRPYEIFTGLQDDEEGIVLPKTVLKGKIIKHTYPNAPSRYDFQFENKRGYKTTVEGLSEKFNPEYWNYAKLISGVLRYRMPIEHVIRLVGSLQLKNESINTWKNGVERALKKYVADEAAIGTPTCQTCGSEVFIEQEGVSVCKHCGTALIG